MRDCCVEYVNNWMTHDVVEVRYEGYYFYHCCC